MSQVKNIPVFIRAKPNKEKKSCWYISNNYIHAVDNNGQKVGEVFAFDHIFDESQSNEDVYKVVEPTVVSAMDGYNTTIFTYGQTSSGKTYTMMGNGKVSGIVQMSFQSIFKMVEENPNKRFLIRLSIIEIYNERINDLLDIENKNVKIRETMQGNVDVQVKTEVVTNVEQVLLLAKIGNKNRKIGSTDMNERSSRSHLIFRIAIEGIDIVDGREVVNSSQVNLVDLAGSERLAYTGAQGERLKEGVNINKSLSSLTRVIRQLNEDGRTFVNFRDSKLTRLLQDSLGGNSNTMIIANITPAYLEETLSTLNFAKEAKLVKNQAVKNEYVTMEEEGKWQEINELKKEYERKLFEETQRNTNLQREQEKRVKDLEDKLKALSSFKGFSDCNGSEKKHSSKRRYTLHDPFSLASAKMPSKPPDIWPEDVSTCSQLSLGLPRIPEEISPITTPAKSTVLPDPSTPETVLRQRCLEWEKSYRELASYVTNENQVENGVDYKEEIQKMRDNYFELKSKFDDQAKKLSLYEQEQRTSPDVEQNSLKQEILQLQQDLESKKKVILHFEESEDYFKKKLTLLEEILSGKSNSLPPDECFIYNTNECLVNDLKDKTNSFEELQCKYTELQSKYDELQNKQNDFLNEIEQYKEHTTRLIIENKDIHLKFNNLLFEKNDLETKLTGIEEIEKDNEKQNCQVMKLIEENRDLSLKLQLKSTEYDTLLNENKQMKETNLRLTIENSDNYLSLQNAQNVQDNLQREIDELKNEIFRFHAENNEINVQLESAYIRQETLQTELDNARKEKEEIQSKLDSLVLDNVQTSQENNDLKESIAKSNSEIDNLKLKLENALMGKEKVELERKTLNENIEKLSAELKEMQQENTSKLEQLEKVEKDNQCLRDLNLKSCDFIKNLCREFELSQKRCDNELDKINKAYVNISKKVQILKSNITELNYKKKVEANSLQLDVKNLKNLIETGVEKQQMLKEESDLKLKQLQSEKDDLQSENERLINEIEHFKVENEKLSQAMNNFILQLENTDKQYNLKLDNFNESHLNMSNQIDRLKSQINYLNVENTSKVSKLHMEIEKLKNLLQTAEDQQKLLKEDSENKLEKMKIERDNIHCDYVKVLNEIDRIKEENQRLSTEHLDNINEYKSALESKTNTEELLKKEVNGLKEQLSNLSEENDALNKNQKNILNEKKALEERLKNIEPALMENVALQESNAVLIRQNTMVARFMENLGLVIEKTAQNYNSRLNEMVQNIVSISQNVATLKIQRELANREQIKIDEQKAHIDRLLDEIKNYKDNHRRMKSDLKEAQEKILRQQAIAEKSLERESYDQLFARYKATEERLIQAENELKKRNEEIQDHVRSTNQMTVTIARLREQVDDLQSDLKIARKYALELEIKSDRVDVQLRETSAQMRQYFDQRNELQAELAKRDEEEEKRQKLKSVKIVEEQEPRRSLGSPSDLKNRRQEMFDKRRNLQSADTCDDCLVHQLKLKDLEDQLEKKEKQYREAMEKYAVKSYENTDLKKKLERLVQEKEVLQMKYKEDMEQLQKKISEKIAELEKKCKELKDNVPREKYEIVKKVCESRKEEIKKLKATLEQLQAR